jgi:hypothetical protein
MIRIIGRSFVVTGIITVLFAAIGSFSAFADEKAKGLPGSWRVTITAGAGTPELPSWYQTLVTFGADGGLVATITDPFLNSSRPSYSFNITEFCSTLSSLFFLARFRRQELGFRASLLTFSPLP